MTTVLVTFKGRPVTIEQLQLMNSAVAAADKDRLGAPLVKQCAEMGIELRYHPPLAVITEKGIT